MELNSNSRPCDRTGSTMVNHKGTAGENTGVGVLAVHVKQSQSSKPGDGAWCDTFHTGSNDDAASRATGVSVLAETATEELSIADCVIGGTRSSHHPGTVRSQSAHSRSKKATHLRPLTRI